MCECSNTTPRAPTASERRPIHIVLAYTRAQVAKNSVTAMLLRNKFYYHYGRNCMDGWYVNINTVAVPL